MSAALELPQQTYARLAQTDPQGQREAALRHALWQTHYRSVRQAALGVVPLELVRDLYTQYRRRWEYLQFGMISNYRSSPRWDQFWRQAALFCERHQVHPELLIREVFRNANDGRLINPNMVVAKRVQEATLAAQAQGPPGDLLETVRANCAQGFQELKRKAIWLKSFSCRPLSDAELLWTAALDHTASAYSLPVYCTVALQAVWPACEALRIPAFTQWMTSPFEYQEVLTDLLPPEWNPGDRRG